MSEQCKYSHSFISFLILVVSRIFTKIYSDSVCTLR